MIPVCGVCVHVATQSVKLNENELTHKVNRTSIRLKHKLLMNTHSSKTLKSFPPFFYVDTSDPTFLQQLCSLKGRGDRLSPY